MTRFTFYDCTIGRQLPSLDACVLAYHVMPNNPELTRNAVRKAADVKQPLILDWEAHEALRRLDPTRATKRENQAALIEAHKILDVCDAENPSIRVGFYGAFPPTQSNYNAIRLNQNDWRAEIGKLSHGRNSIIDRLHTLYPGMYLPRTWREEWNKFRGAAETVLKLVAGVCRDWQKPCIPFIRPSGFDSVESWNEWVGLVRQECSGAVIWEQDAFSTEYWEIINQQDKAF